MILKQMIANKKHHIYHDCPPGEKVWRPYSGFSADTFLESVQKLFD